MLKDYKEGQPVAYNILNNEVQNNSVTHAYLFQADNQHMLSSFALSFAKTLLCPYNKNDDIECDDCLICKRVDSSNFPELKIVEPDGLWIKKEQLLELQETLKTKSLEGGKRIYIIKEVDKLNVQAANSILKFLEEPEQDIIAILTTSDIHSVLQTIISRCQVIFLKGKDNIYNIDAGLSTNITLNKIGNLFYKNKADADKFVSDEKNVAKIDAIVTFVKKYETIKLDILLETKKLWADYFTDKSEYIWGLDIMALFYKDILNLMYGRKPELFDHYLDTAKFIVSLNKIEDIIFKIQKILLIKEKVKYNINTSLLMDKLILELESEEYI